MQRLSLVIPCYNEAEVIEIAYSSMRKVADLLRDYAVSLIFVNDGSTDATGALLSRIAQEDSAVTVLHFSRNFGHQAAVTAGIHHADSDYVVLLDADLQDPPELIPAMLETLKRENANVVYGVRKQRRGETLLKRSTSKWFYRSLNRLTEQPIPLDAGDFRLMDRRIVEEFNRFREKGKYVRGIISWVGFKQVPFYYERQPRQAGVTKYPLRKIVHFAGTAMFYFSKKPLKLASSLGFVAVLLGILFAIWTIFGKIFGFTNAGIGWSSIIVLIIFFGGVQLLTVGVLGQYIGILFDEVKDRPEYIVEKIEHQSEEVTAIGQD